MHGYVRAESSGNGERGRPRVRCNVCAEPREWGGDGQGGAATCVPIQLGLRGVAAKGARLLACRVA